MKHYTASYILACVILLVFCSVSLAAVPVKVSVGKTTIVTLKEPSKRISLSNPEIADLNLISPTEILINGKKVGSTDLIVWDSKGKMTFFDVNVVLGTCSNLSDLEKYIKEIAPDSNITASCDGDTLVLRGTTPNRNTCKRDKESFVTHRDEKQMVDVIESQEKDICVETITKIEQIAKVYSPKVLNLVTVPDAEQVMLEVRVAQIDKTKLKELGVSWMIKGKSAEGFMNLIGAPLSQGTTTSSGGTTVSAGGQGGIAGNGPGLGTFQQLDPFQVGVSYFPAGVGVVLNLLQQNGLAKILAQPNLVVRSGESGKFLVGTRVPIQTVTGIGAGTTPSITFEEVGIKLNFVPQVLENGAIRLRVDPAEVSNITQFIQFVGGVSAPEIDTRQITTSVDLKDGESLILAGLLSEEMKKNIQKLPLFGDIPILGALFRSTSDELTKKELAFFITPKLVKPIPAGVKTELPQERPITPEEEKEYQWIPLGK